jgi:hypothetical protein
MSEERFDRSMRLPYLHRAISLCQNPRWLSANRL